MISNIENIGGKKMGAKKFLAMAIALGLAVGATAMPTLAADKKTFVFGDTTFNA